MSEGATADGGKALLLPVRFASADEEFDAQLRTLGDLLSGVAELMHPITLGERPPASDAVLFPQLLGEAYRRVEELRALDRPRLVITSEFGTVQMWDWEICRFLAEEGVSTLAPYRLEQARTLCRALALRREMRRSSFVVYQDDPGQGAQAPIFKRFYWWEDACTRRILETFGVKVERRSFKKLAEAARAISDAEADRAWERWRHSVPLERLPERARRAALKLYLKLKRDLGDDENVHAAGINCLNESHFSDTTPCLAWNLLFEERGVTWGCEADTVSMLTQNLLYRSLQVPLMMTNLYPFLLGEAALKHERIPAFPDVEEPEHHVLVAHCGYLGVVPQSFATSWAVRPKVLAIVDDNAHALDAHLPEGPVTLVKLSPSMDALVVVEGRLTGYAHYPGSDCLTGGIIRVPNGPALMRSLPSHHGIIVVGHRRAELEMVAQIFGLRLEIIV